MLCDIVVRRRWVHAANHFYHEKRVVWVSVSMQTCDPVPIVMGLHLAAQRAAGAMLLIFLKLKGRELKIEAYKR